MKIRQFGMCVCLLTKKSLKRFTKYFKLSTKDLVAN